jgi:hypothetical protein
MLREGQIFDTGMNHQVEEIEDKSLVVPQVQERLDTLFLECLILRVLIASHGIHHLLADTDRRLQDVLCRRILTKYESEIDMKQMTQFVDH